MTDPLEALVGAGLPELAAAVRKCAAKVISRFSAVVREALPTADALALTDLIDNLPPTLQAMADALDRAGAKAEVRELSGDSRLHGQSRFDQNYNLGELLQEYAILRSVLIEEVPPCMSRPPTAREVIALNACVDVSVRRAVVTFVNQQKAELQQTAEAQAKHLSFLSHDLRGSLNGILLMIEVLKRELAAHSQFAESLEDLDMMRRSILETVTTMDRFLYAERFRKGKVVVKNGPVDVNHVVSDVVAQFSYQARDKSLPLRAEVPSCQITSDRALISVILQNLIGNAVKFTRKGEVVVRGQPAPDRATYRLTVTDTGPGIEPDKLGKMFSPFVRGETHGTEGVGLGLSIARQAADLLGARLWAESEVARGSTFHLELKNAAPGAAASR